MDPGRFDRRVTILRRPVVDEVSRGEYGEVFKLWSAFRSVGVRQAVEGGRAQDIESGILSFRDSPNARSITIADRVMIAGRSFGIDGVALPDRRTGLINVSVASNFGGQ